MTSVLALRIPHAWTQAACSSVQGEGKPFLLPTSRDGGFAVSVQTSGEAVGLPAPDSPATLVALVHSHTVAVEGTDATPVSTTSTKRDGATHDTDWDPFYNPAPKYGKGCFVVHGASERLCVFVCTISIRCPCSPEPESSEPGSSEQPGSSEPGSSEPGSSEPESSLSLESKRLEGDPPPRPPTPTPTPTPTTNHCADVCGRITRPV